MLLRLMSSRWFAFVLAVVVHGAWTRGVPRASPDTMHYVELADGFATRDVSKTFTLEAVRYTKTIYLSVMSGARAVSEEHWMHILVLVNVVASGFVALMLFDLVSRATRSRIAPPAALALYIGCFDVLQWVPFVVTDILFTAVAFVPFYLAGLRLLDRERPLSIPLMSVALLVTIFTRPPGLLLLLLVVAAEVVGVRRALSPRAAAVIVLAFIGAAVFVRTAVVHDPARWPFAFVQPKLVEFSAREKTGEVVYDRRETFHAPPRTASDHLLIQADRFVRYFQVTVADFSRAHNLINVAYFGALYVLAAMAAISAWRGPTSRARPIIFAALFWIFSFAVLHALTILDYDWRFRVPVLPHMILLAACGLDAVIVRLGFPVGTPRGGTSEALAS